MTRAMTGAVTTPPRPPQARALVSAAPPAEAPPRRPLVFSFLSSLSSSLTTRARASQRHPHHPPVRPDDGVLCARGSHTPPRPRARERARPRPPSGDIATRRHDDANLGWQAAAAVPRLTEPPNPNPNPNDARIERMTRKPTRATSPNPPPHARERARPTPPPRPPARRRDPHATQHTTRPRAVASPPPAPPRRIAPTTHRRSSDECLYLCVVLWPSGVWFCILIRLFARALTRGGKRRVRGRVVAKKSRISEKGRCFVLNRAGGALP